MANILVKPEVYEIEKQVESVHKLISERPKIVTSDSKKQFLQRGVELGLFHVEGQMSKIRIKSIIILLNQYLINNGEEVIYTQKKVYARVGSKVEHPTQYTFTIKKL